MRAIRWKRLSSPDAVRALLLRELPPASQADAIRQFLTRQHLTWADQDQDIVCSAPARGIWPFVSGIWLIKFHVPDETLTDVSVRRILTGP